jgi:hypothetical protein
MSSSFPSIIDNPIVAEEPPGTAQFPLRILNRWSLISTLLRQRPICSYQVFPGVLLCLPACQHHRFDRLPYRHCGLQNCWQEPTWSLTAPSQNEEVRPITRTLQSLQASFSNCGFLIIDEKSIIDLKTLSLIDDRLRAIFLASSDLLLGG